MNDESVLRKLQRDLWHIIIGRIIILREMMKYDNSHRDSNNKKQAACLSPVHSW